MGQRPDARCCSVVPIDEPHRSCHPVCQNVSADLPVGVTLRHIDDCSIPMKYRCNEALQLHRTMRAFAEAVESGDTPGSISSQPRSLSPSLAITYSALLTLYDAYSCSLAIRQDGGEARLQMQKVSIDGLKDVTDRVLGFRQHLRIGHRERWHESCEPVGGRVNVPCRRKLYVSESRSSAYDDTYKAFRDVDRADLTRPRCLVCPRKPRCDCRGLNHGSGR